MRRYPEKGYACPLCTCCQVPGVRFRHSTTLDAYLCEGCSSELPDFAEMIPAPEDPLVASFETSYGRPFTEYQKHHLTVRLEEAERKRMKAAGRRMVSKKFRQKAIRRWEQAALKYQELLDRLAETSA